MQLVYACSEVAEYKFDIQKSVAFVYNKNELSKNEIKKTIPFAIASGR